MVYRVCVEKKPGLAPECASLLSDCRSFLDLKGLESVRIWNRYDVEGIDEDPRLPMPQIPFSPSRSST